MISIYVFIFILGTIIGSFLNVVIDRFNTGRGLGGRSRCDAIGKVLSWYELIPVVSYVLQKGKSRHSKTTLSPQYPLVELGTGLMFLILFIKLWPLVYSAPSSFILLFLVFCYLISLLIIIFVYDIKHKIIPNFFIWQFNVVVLLIAIIFNGSLLAILAGPIVALPLFLLWFVSKGKWLGFGDVKFALGMGWLLGISGGFAALLLSFWIGALIGIFVLLIQKKKNHQLPFAPFLVIGTLLAFLYTITMNSVSKFFMMLM